MSLTWHLRAELRYLLLAVQFFTRVPVPRWVNNDFDERLLASSARYFPLVGIFVGMVAAAVYVPASWWLPPLSAALISLAATLWLTGAFHEDGLTDTIDALGATPDRVKALAIMKDSRIGAYGAIGVIVVLMLKVSLLADMPIEVGAVTLIAAHALSRAYAVGLIAVLPYARDDADTSSKSKPLASRVSPTSTVVAVLFGALPWLAVVLYDGLAVQWLLALLLSFGTCAYCGWWFWRRLGGFTGDALGACQQLTEVAFYLGVAMQITQ
jgi:adenosylcobinamide-GDP ribazoletransferase